MLWRFRGANCSPNPVKLLIVAVLSSIFLIIVFLGVKINIEDIPRQEQSAQTNSIIPIIKAIEDQIQDHPIGHVRAVKTIDTESNESESQIARKTENNFPGLKVDHVENGSNTHQEIKQEVEPTDANHKFYTVWICHVRASYGTDINAKYPEYVSYGFAKESIDFLLPLCRKLPTRFGWHEESYRNEAAWMKDPIWLEMDLLDQEVLLNCYHRGEELLKKKNSHSRNDIYIGMMQWQPFDLPKIRKNYPELSGFHYLLTRTMFETNSLPKNWDSYINKNSDEVWVPSHFEQHVLETNGIQKVVTVIGEGFDPIHMDDSHTKNMRKELFPSCKDDDFIFVSVSKFEDRKGFDHLLEAYANEFTDQDKVCLALRCNGARTQMDILMAQQLEKTSARLCRVPRVSEGDYLSLYRSSDAFVLATHGEGWGRTIMEAMAMGLPVLVPLWGGVTEYLNANVSVPIVVNEEERPPKKWPIHENYSHHHWAKVDPLEIQKSMRWVFDHPEEGAEIGAKAKQFAWSKYTREKVADRAIERLDAIAEMLQPTPHELG